MAAPDTSLLTSSAQIFSSNYTLPQIRTIHKALHTQIDDKAARLRTQVGGSYRELLGTADAIVQMRHDMDAVQATLGRMGARCGRAVVGTKVAGLARFARDRAGADGEMGRVARARLLEACALTVGRMLRPSATGAAVGDDGSSRLSRGERLVVAAKVLVLSRLLVKGLAEEEDVSVEDTADMSASVEASKKSLGSLRQRLLRVVDKALGRVNGNGDGSHREDVLQALCAYSLATSSGARDVVRHFLHVRGEAMALAFQAEESEAERSPKDVLASLALYTRTLLDVQALMPGKLTEALAGLKKNALLADETLRRSEGLRLDLYRRWCGDDIQHFKPYIRHDDLDGPQAKEMLTGWASWGGEVLMRNLEKTLERLFEFQAIVDLRTSVLQLWIRDGGKARGFDPSVMLDKLRAALNRHMLQVLSMKVNKLRLVGVEVAASLESWQDGVTDRHGSLWDDGGDGGDFGLDDLHLSDGGATQFTREVVARLYGRSDAVSRVVACYRSWHRVVDDVAAVAEQLRRQRWDNDVDEIEDEETIERRQQLLSRDDPQTLLSRLDSALAKTFGELEKQLGGAWEAARRDGEGDGDGEGDNGSSPSRGRVAMYLVRVLRDVRSGLPRRQHLQTVEGFGLALVPSLHEAMVAATVAGPLDEFGTMALRRKTVVGRSLWEGVPELPTSPSPGTFRFLRNLVVAMGDAGMDLWSPTAVLVLKTHVAKRLGGLWLEAVAAGGGEETTNGSRGEGEAEKQAATEAEAELPTAEQRVDLLIQWLFDVSMLRCCLGLADGAKDDPLGELEDAIYKRTGLESSSARERLNKASQDYWKRSNLLFGLLT